MHQRRLVVPVIAAVLSTPGLFGCKAKLSSELKIDGKAFTPSECRSGEVYNFVGVELRAKDGTTLRLAQSPTNEAIAFLIPTGSRTGVEIGACGAFTVTRQNSSINDVTNVKGRAELACEGAGHSIAGTVEFENCH